MMGKWLSEWWWLIALFSLIGLLVWGLANYITPEAYYERFDAFMTLCFEGEYSRIECLAAFMAGQ